MVNSSGPWEKAKVFINGVLVTPGSSGVMYPGQSNKMEVEVPEESVRTLRFAVVESGELEPDADPEWGTDIKRVAGMFTSLVTFTGNSTGSIRLIIYSPDTTAVLEVLCEVKEGKPSLRFYYASAGQYAPQPPAVVELRVNSWYGVDLKLTDSTGSPISGVRATMYRPEKEPVSGHSNAQGVISIFTAYQYTTLGPRTFEAVATLPSGEARATFLINVMP
ncbi:hypothetical protein [Pseudomonas putida]|uniref:hypothetical protein n=1 Tax=Pseudomonas putida TaxID=303 RepID=UPI003D95516B